MEENEVVMEGAKKAFPIKKLIIAIIAIVVVVAAVIGIVNLVKPTPEKTVKEFLKAFGNKKASKVVDCYDFVGASAWAACDGDYEDFADNYKDFKEEFEDEEEDYNDMIDEAKEGLEESFEEVDKLKIEIKDVKKAKSVKKAKNLYTVKAKVKVEYKLEDEDDTERDTSTYNFYVYKKSGKYYIVGIETVSGDGVLSSMMM